MMGKKNINTNALFLCILKSFNADCVFDIGARDGKQSLLFRSALPKAQIMAFEANPRNFKKISNDDKIKDNSIKIFNLAVCERNGTTAFFIDQNIGMSSILTPSTNDTLEQILEIDSVRLDTFIINSGLKCNNIGLWIDVEGSSFEVLSGIENCVHQISFIHVEVENYEMRQNQHTFEAVYELAHKYGFEMVATSLIDEEKCQGDTVFIHKRVLSDPNKLNGCLFKGRLIQYFCIPRIIQKMFGNKIYQYAKKSYSKYFG